MARLAAALALLATALVIPRQAAAGRSRLKDIARLEGERENQITGQGLVVGLNGTGDRSTALAAPELASVLSRLGRSTGAVALKSKNSAVVMLTATLPAFARTGARIDVSVSSILDAKSLEGGILVQAPLIGADGLVHAVAQGPLVVGGFSASAGGDSVSRNVPTVGVIPGGAIVEREGFGFDGGRDRLRLVLREADFATATAAAAALRDRFGSELATATDSRTLDIVVPPEWRGRVPELVSAMEQVLVDTDGTGRVVVNERTGTVVISEHVRVSSVAIAHGNLSVAISTTPVVSQPPPLSGGRTVAVADTEVGVGEEPGGLAILPDSVALQDLVAALNALGASPRDLISILHALESSGALHAEIVVN